MVAEPRDPGTMASEQMLAALLQQLSQLTTAMQQNGAAATPTTPPPGLSSSGPRRLIDSRHLKLPTFDGRQGQLDDWTFAVKRSIRSVSRPSNDLPSNDILAHVETRAATTWVSSDIVPNVPEVVKVD